MSNHDCEAVRMMKKVRMALLAVVVCCSLALAVITSDDLFTYIDMIIAYVIGATAGVAGTGVFVMRGFIHGHIAQHEAFEEMERRARGTDR